MPGHERSSFWGVPRRRKRGTGAPNGKHSLPDAGQEGNRNDAGRSAFPHALPPREFRGDQVTGPIAPANPETFDDLKERGVRVVVMAKHISVNPDPNGDVKFNASVDDDRIVSLTVQTETPTGARAAYFERHRASDLAGRAIGHFAENGGVEGVAFDWGRPATDLPGDSSTNYTAYVAERDRLVAEGVPYDDAKEQAVKGTWTFNRVAAPHGFMRISGVDITETGDPASPTGVQGVLRRDTVKADAAHPVTAEPAEGGDLETSAYRMKGELEKQDPSIEALPLTPITPEAQATLESWGMSEGTVNKLRALISSLRYDLVPQRAARMAERGAYIYETPEGGEELVLPDFNHLRDRLDGACVSLNVQFFVLLHETGLHDEIQDEFTKQGKPGLAFSFLDGNSPTHFTEAPSNHSFAGIIKEISSKLCFGV